MVFLRLHHVKSLTFNFASSIFPFLTVAVLEFKNQKLQNKKQTPILHHCTIETTAA